MKSLPILHKIESLPDLRRVEILEHQGVAGLFEYFYPHLVTEGEGFFKQQQQRNIIYEQEALALNSLMKQEGKELLFLKGITFLEDLYPELGTRFMSDIDCYCRNLDYQWLKSFMEKHGYRYLDTPKWIGNKHKCEFSKKTVFGTVNFEFHNRLFWHREDPAEISVKRMRLNRLAHEENFVYLCGHYAFLHSCQKLYWLWDLYLFCRLYRDSLDMDRVYFLARYFGFEKSVHFVLRLLKEAFDIDMNWQGKKSWLKIKDEVFFSDNQRSFYYLYLKTFLKDSSRDNLTYYLGYFLKNDS